MKTVGEFLIRSPCSARRVSLAVVVAALCTLAGCTHTRASDTIWNVQLRDPRDVAISVTTLGGNVVVSPRGALPSTSYIPESVPPFADDDCLGARVLRGTNGAIVLERARC